MVIAQLIESATGGPVEEDDSVSRFGPVQTAIETAQEVADRSGYTPPSEKSDDNIQKSTSVDESGSVNARMEVDTSVTDSYIEIDGTLSGEIGISSTAIFNRVIGNDINYTATIEYDVIRHNIKRYVNDLENGIISQFQSGGFGDGSFIDENILDDSSINTTAIKIAAPDFPRPNTEKLLLKASIRLPLVDRTTEIGTSPVKFGGTFPFRRMVVPDTEYTRRQIRRFPDFEMEITMEPREFIQRQISSLTDDLPSVTVKIEPEMYTEFVDPETFFNMDTDFLSCEDVSRLVKNSVDSFTSSTNRIENRDIQNINVSRVDSLLNEAEEVRSTINSEVDNRNPCKSELLSRVNRSERDLRSIKDRIQLQDNFSPPELPDPDKPSLPDEPSPPDVTPPDVDCENISKLATNSVIEYESAVKNFQKGPKFEGDKERKEKLIEEADEVIGVVEGEITDNDKCLERLKRRVERARNKVENTRIIQRETVPCEDRFPDVEERVSDIEDRSSEVTPSTDKDVVEGINKSIDEVIKMLDEVDAQDCKNEFRRRVDKAENKTDVRSRGVRVSEEKLSTEEARRREILRNIGLQ